MKVKFTVRLPSVFAERVENIAKQTNVSMNNVFNTMVVTMLANGSAVEDLKKKLQRASFK